MVSDCFEVSLEWEELGGGERVVERVGVRGAVVVGGSVLLLDSPQGEQGVGKEGPGGGLWVLTVVVEDVPSLTDHLSEDVGQSLRGLEGGVGKIVKGGSEGLQVLRRHALTCLEDDNALVVVKPVDGGTKE